jgi:hypothetical protein
MKLEDIKNRTKEAADYLVQSLEAGHSEVLTQYLGAMAKFHTYSFGNIMLIARQKPSATKVAGVRTWNSLGRFVRRGEKGILILAPMVGRKRQPGEETTGENGDEKNPQAQLHGFRAVYVFDISQTEGKDLPALTEVQGDVGGYRERLIKFVEAQSIELNLSLVTIQTGFEISNFAGQLADQSAITLWPCSTCFGSGSEPWFACFVVAAAS